MGLKNVDFPYLCDTTTETSTYIEDRSQTFKAYLASVKWDDNLPKLTLMFVCEPLATDDVAEAVGVESSPDSIYEDEDGQVCVVWTALILVIDTTLFENFARTI